MALGAPKLQTPLSSASPCEAFRTYPSFLSTTEEYLFGELVFPVTPVGLQHAAEPFRYCLNPGLPLGAAFFWELQRSRLLRGLGAGQIGALVPRPSVNTRRCLVSCSPACLHNKDESYVVGVEKGCDVYFNLFGLLNLGKRALAAFIGRALRASGSARRARRRTSRELRAFTGSGGFGSCSTPISKTLLSHFFPLHALYLICEAPSENQQKDKKAADLIACPYRAL